MNKIIVILALILAFYTQTFDHYQTYGTTTTYDIKTNEIIEETITGDYTLYDAYVHDPVGMIAGLFGGFVMAYVLIAFLNSLYQKMKKKNEEIVKKEIRPIDDD